MILIPQWGRVRRTLDTLPIVAAFSATQDTRASSERQTPAMRRSSVEMTTRYCSLVQSQGTLFGQQEVFVQDRYAGDEGDFGKYGLLRWLCGTDAYGPPLRLGVLWYRFEDATPGNGKYVSYLRPPRARGFCACDPDLFERMRSIVSSERSIARVEASGALPSSTVFFSEKLVFARYEPRSSREKKRRDWLTAGLRAVAKADLVFADPDNGLEVASVGRLRARGPKYVYYDDLREVWARGQSLVIYQHMARNRTAERQISARCDELRRHLDGADRVIALRWRRRTSRAYFVVPATAHADRLIARHKTFLASRWGQHFTL